MIRTEGLSKQYGELRAVENLNLHVEKGEIYGFLGPNGAGKTTTIMMLLGLVRPSSGRVQLFGRDLESDYFGIKRRIGVLAEFQYLYEEMTAAEYLAYFCDLYQVENKQSRIQEVLELVNLYDRRNELLRGYSKGMKQKLSLARALLHDPEVLILDEPQSSLDPYGIKEVRDIIMEENRKGRTFLISSHILSEIERTCHRVGIIQKGHLIAEDTMENIKRRATEEVKMTVELEKLSPELVNTLKAMPFVLNVSEHGNKLVLKTKADADYRGQVSSAISEAGGVVLELHRHELSLEEAFVTLTEKNISFFAKEGSAA